MSTRVVHCSVKVGAAATAGSSRPKNAARAISCAMKAAPSWEGVVRWSCELHLGTGLATEARETDAGGCEEGENGRVLRQAKRS